MLLFLFSACNFDFPKENEEIWFATDLEYHFNTGSDGGGITLAFPDLGSKTYRIMVYPQWIETGKLEGVLDNGYGSIPFSFKNVDSFMTGNRVEGYIFIRLDETILRLTISYGVVKLKILRLRSGSVVLQYCRNKFWTEDSRSFTIANHGEVDKTWYITTFLHGSNFRKLQAIWQQAPHLPFIVQFAARNFFSGEYSLIIHIESSHPQSSHGIRVNMVVEDPGPPVNSARLKWFSGTVTDAYFCKKTDYLYILTKSPNALLVKTPQSDSLTTYPLDRIPNCIDVTADGKTLAIGYNQAFVDLLDATTLERIKQYVIDCVPTTLFLAKTTGAT
jgi:hypothetical protein